MQRSFKAPLAVTAGAATTATTATAPYRAPTEETQGFQKVSTL